MLNVSSGFQNEMPKRILNVNWLQKINCNEIIKRTEININIVERIIQRKLTCFGHICRMRDDRMTAC